MRDSEVLDSSWSGVAALGAPPLAESSAIQPSSDDAPEAGCEPSLKRGRERAQKPMSRMPSAFISSASLR